MRHHIKFPKQPNLIQFLLLFPIIGFLDLKDDIKRDTIEGFTTTWVLYILLTAFWLSSVILIIHTLYTSPTVLLIIGAIIVSIIFLLVIAPRVLYKLVNRKPRK